MLDELKTLIEESEQIRAMNPLNALRAMVGGTRPMRVKDAYADTYQQDKEESDHICSSDCRKFGHNF